LKDQYTGDIGDYTKFGLLRALEERGFTVGVNWYLTPDDHQNQGQLVHYLLHSGQVPDPQLFNSLRDLIASGTRTVAALEQAKLLCHAVYFGKVLELPSGKDRMGWRETWHQEALSALKGQSVVFLDPDNGLIVPSVRPHWKAGSKYVTDEEVMDYYRRGASVIIYNHRDRSPEPKYMEKLTRFAYKDETASARLLCLTAKAGTVRDYLILAQPQHSNALGKTIDNMLRSGWERYCSLRALRG
jgi:hypothetical protein